MLKRAMILSAFLLQGALVNSVQAAEKFTLASPDIQAGKMLSKNQEFNSFGCNGKNISPELQWKNAPKATRSFAVTVYDPDAPTGSGWWHWLVLNIPASSKGLPAGMKAEASGSLQTRTDYGVAGFGGACPPKGDKPHRYQFTVYALDVDSLPVTADSMPAFVGFNLHAHTLAKAQLEALYQR